MAAVALIGFVTWTMTATSHHGGATNRGIILTAEAATAAMRTSDPSKAYFGLVLGPGPIGYILDGDETMSPYIGNVALVTNGLNADLPREASYGIVQATAGDEAARLHEVFEPAGELPGAGLTAYGRLAKGETRLGEQLALANQWNAQQLFVVLSKPLVDAEIESLAALAEKTGAITNVIALGEAARQPAIARISSATGGTFVPVMDDALASLASVYRSKIDSHRPR